MLFNCQAVVLFLKYAVHYPHLLLSFPLLYTQAPTHAATVYHGGDILTMDGPEPAYVPALVVKGGKIAFTGSPQLAAVR